DRRFTVRLVKGAYWDTEIKHAQVMGVEGFPVFTRKAATDVSYIANTKRLLGMTDRIYPQFATHSAHTAAAILDMAGLSRDFEFQKLHGMGNRLHELVMAQAGTSCRIYAPVGAHRDLLAYLVRRLLENGANSSFVNQIVDEDVSPAQVAADPFAALGQTTPLLSAPDLYRPERVKSRGWDIAHRPMLDRIEADRAAFGATKFEAAPLLATRAEPHPALPVLNPATGDTVGSIRNATAGDAANAIAAAAPWDAPVAERARILNAAADLYEQHHARLFALLAREAGKTLADAVGELREAVDFLRYYAARAEIFDRPARGVFTCISPWNFPLAIFTGQIAGALACGNGVLAKPAERTPLIAHAAVSLLHEGVPAHALQLLPGDGATVGAALTSDAKIAGVAFTRSTETAQMIRRSLAAHLDPGAPLIAETGGLNAMIVDSTALPEQAVRDVVQSAFQSAGQRCSALRCLYVQEEIASDFKKMLFGAMESLALGDPWDIATDVGPLIDAEAKDAIAAYIDKTRRDGRVLKQCASPDIGHFIAPTVIAVDGIADMDREIFGPVLHIATFRADKIDRVLADINATGYGLTFGLHTRIDDRVQHVVERLAIGNIYVNRNQIGAIVGSQPFGGEGLSGTGPKAGGPEYLTRFTAPSRVKFPAQASGDIAAVTVQSRIDSADQPALLPADVLVERHVCVDTTASGGNAELLAEVASG
ncbi:MAG: bifunctional proline dehydrogenase/L-glutamate gamma-semialdehyde dehydrogenase PutA, partial [Rhodobacter sp.]|nr:bifunctional proline dehydrogenase/L-glutamate gamma-semialdehyde dehydrogenase PutA [Rhodobacter sp.]